MKKSEIAKMFLTQEIYRRAQRRQRLLNEMALETEPLSKEDLKIKAAVLNDIKQQQLQHEKNIRPGYWQRLWAAIRGK